MPLVMTQGTMCLPAAVGVVSIEVLHSTSEAECL